MERKLLGLLNCLKKSLLELIYPSKNRCIICNKEFVHGLCQNCYKSIKYSDDEFCLGYYGGTLKRLILKLKYERDFEAGRIIVEMLKEKIKNISSEFYLTYVPMDDEALSIRGFNQCEYLAQELSNEEDRIVINTLIKVKKTKIQKTLSREERYENIKDAFKVVEEKRVYGRKFILIDDVITTGATLSECIKVLKKSGADEIKILTVAKSYI